MKDKRIFASLITAALLFAGCGAQTRKIVPGAPSSGPASNQAVSAGMEQAESSASVSPVEALPRPSAETPAGYAKAVVTFPAYQEGRTEHNQKIYETKPFKLHMALPEGWSVRQPAETARRDFAFTPMEICDGGLPVGRVGFNVFEVSEDVPEENQRRMIYNQLMLGSTVNWDNDYNPVAQTETACTATCRVMHKDSGPEWEGRLPEAPEYYNPAILSYEKNLPAYIAMAFKDGAVTDEQLQTIARSIRLEGIV